MKTENCGYAPPTLEVLQIEMEKGYSVTGGGFEDDLLNDSMA